MIQDQVFKKQFNWNIWGPPIAFIILLIIEKQASGTFFSSLLYGLILILTGIIYTMRYRLYQPALLFCLAGLTLWHYVLAAHVETIFTLARWLSIDGAEPGTGTPSSMLTWLINLMIFLAVVPLTIPVLGKAFALEENAKKLFRLAAMTVPGHEDGFTSRPYAGGDTALTEEQIKGFARFMAGHLISVPVFLQSGVTLAFSMGRSPLSVNEPSGISYVKFDYEKGISVRIAERDYKRFSRKFTFDLLCGSMEKVFRRFMEHYINKEENRILNELNQTTYN